MKSDIIKMRLKDAIELARSKQKKPWSTTRYSSGTGKCIDCKKVLSEEEYRRVRCEQCSKLRNKPSKYNMANLVKIALEHMTDEEKKLLHKEYPNFRSVLEAHQLLTYNACYAIIVKIRKEINS